MSDCRFGVSPVNYPDPDPDGAKSRLKTVFALLWVCMTDLSDSCFEGVKIRIEDEISW